MIACLCFDVAIRMFTVSMFAFVTNVGVPASTWPIGVGFVFNSKAPRLLLLSLCARA